MNMFSLLDEDSENEQPIAEKVAKEKKVKPTKPASTVTAPATTTVANTTTSPAATIPETVPTTGSNKSTKGKTGENAPPSNIKQKEIKGSLEVKTPAIPSNQVDDVVKDDQRGGKPRGDRKDDKGRGRGGHHRSDPEHPDEPPRRKSGEINPKREFDRRSGTGRGRGDFKKGGRGSYNFGNVAQEALEAEKNPASVIDGDKKADVSVPTELNGEVAVTADSEPAWGVTADGEATTADANAPIEPEVVAEPEPVTYTLDEYMQTREQARAKALQLMAEVKPTARSAYTSGLENLTAASNELDSYIATSKVKTSTVKKDQRSNGKNAVLDVSFKFEAVSQRERDERPGGGRVGSRNSDRPGRGREGGGRGGGRGAAGDRARPGQKQGFSSSRSESAPTTAFSTEDFPSL